MNPVSRRTSRRPDQAEPAWDVAYLFPFQGAWSEEDYLELSTNHLVEFVDGFIEVLPMPTTSHQLLVLYLFGLLSAFVAERNLGTVLVAALRVRLWRGRYREPDIVLMLKEHSSRMREEYWKGADLVMEVVSKGRKDRERDLETKRREYARAGIPEYWIVDPFQERITVLRLAGKRYIEHGDFPKGTVATSHLLQGFSIDVAKALASQVVETGRKSRQRRK